MSKKFFFVLILLIFSSIISFENVNSASVDLVTSVYKDETIFNYIFTFDEEEGYDKFSIEKPKDAKLDYVVDQNGPIKYEIAGDYYIFRPEDSTGSKTILLKFRSTLVSKEIYTAQAFKTYVNFDFPVEVFEFKVEFKDNFGEIISIFPENYILLPNNKIYWESYNLSKYNVYIVNFKDNTGDLTPSTKIPDYYFIIIIALIFVSLVSMFFLYLQYKSKKNDKLNSTIIISDNENINSNENVYEVNNISEIESKRKELTVMTENSGNQPIVLEKKVDEKEQLFNEIMEKHLTDNEKNIVIVIKENEGIAQNDVLNFLPQLTKSNLSKIVSKLDSRKILKRIKVGKVNHIYLGEKLDKKREKKSFDDEIVSPKVDKNN